MRAALPLADARSPLALSLDAEHTFPGTELARTGDGPQLPDHVLVNRDSLSGSASVPTLSLVHVPHFLPCPNARTRSLIKNSMGFARCQTELTAGGVVM